jgi:beta-1,2-mannobiose phosphorylase / 1,2-beta-oligomannan phosphorylase
MKPKILIQPKDIKPSFPEWKVVSTINPAVIRRKDGKILMYIRVAEQDDKHTKGGVCPVITSTTGLSVSKEKITTHQLKKRNKDMLLLKDGTCRLTHISHLRKVLLDESGTKVLEIDDEPTFTGIAGESDYGVEDPRFTLLNGKYYMTYVGVSKNEGVSTYLAESKDLENWKRRGLIFREQNKDAILFPERVDGEYVAFNRPESAFHFSKPGIWISYSKDLVYWGRDRNLARPRVGSSWEDERIGGGAVPIKTKKGWLCIYHGVKIIKKKKVYSAGVMLLDLKHPTRIIARSPLNKPLFKPKEKFEKKGFISNVVFPTAAIPTLDGKDLLIYSGGADSITTVRKISIKKIMDSMKSVKKSNQ